MLGSEVMGPGRRLGGTALLLLLLGAAFGWLGPNGTYRLPLLARFGFWLVAMPLIGLIAVACIELLRRGSAKAWPVPAQGAAGALLASLPGFAAALGLHALFGDPLSYEPAELLRVYVSETVVLLLVAVPLTMLASRPAPPAAPSSAAGEPLAAASSFLRRLPPELGDELLSIAGEDHYLRVTTARGSTLILLRLSDAVAELDPAAGLQVHRSYWVARRALAGVERDGQRLALRLVNGQRVPVSRTYVAGLKQAGWLES